MLSVIGHSVSGNKSWAMYMLGGLDGLTAGAEGGVACSRHSWWISIDKSPSMSP